MTLGHVITLIRKKPRKLFFFVDREWEPVLLVFLLLSSGGVGALLLGLVALLWLLRLRLRLLIVVEVWGWRQRRWISGRRLTRQRRRHDWDGW